MTTSSSPRSLALFESLIESLHVGVVLHGSQGEVTLFNAAARELLGLTDEQLRRATPNRARWRFTRTDGTPLPRAAEPIARALRDHAPVRQVVLGVQRPSHDDSRWLLVSAEPELEADGSVRHVLCTYTDVTERVETEARHELVAKTEVIARMASGIAHDFANVLASIRAHSDLAKLVLEDTHNAFESLVAIDEVVEQARRFTDRLRTLSKRKPHSLQIFDLNRVVRDLSLLLRSLLGDPIVMTLDLHPGELPLRGDMAQLEQIVLNLAVNARDALPRGGQIVISSRRTTRDGTAHVCLSVSDDGDGIEAEHLDRIFDPFFTTKQDRGGSGLGLSTCMDLARQVGGWVEVTSRSGEGARFDVFLPLAADGDAPTASTSNWDARHPRGSERVLLVEDDHYLCELTAGLLTSLGYHVDACRSAPDALERLDQDVRAYDVVVSDLLMPRMSGVELRRAIRERRASLPVLLMTGDAPDDGDGSDGAETKTPLLRKPFGLGQLARTVREVLDHRGTSSVIPFDRPKPEAE